MSIVVFLFSDTCCAETVTFSRPVPTAHLERLACLDPRLSSEHTLALEGKNGLSWGRAFPDTFPGTGGTNWSPHGAGQEG